MSEKIYPKGIMIFKPRDNAPDFVKGQMVITPNELVTFLKTVEEHKTEYKGNVQFKFDLLDGNKGLYLALNTYKKSESDPF